MFLHKLAQLTTGFTPIVDKKYAKEDYLAIDLSGNNKALNAIDITNANEFEAYVKQLVEQNNKKLAQGGYLEKRALYQRSKYFTNTQEVRNTHLGIDVWAPTGTNIVAPIDGEIYGIANNDNFGDYGPTIILQHNFFSESFYSLYGHLDLQSLDQNAIGKEIKAGTSFAKLGGPAVNGDYAPHLHFQLIKNLEGKTNDYPGVCSEKDVAFYKENCPDPNILLKID